MCLQEMELLQRSMKTVGWAVDLGLCPLVLVSLGRGHGCSDVRTKWAKFVYILGKVGFWAHFSADLLQTFTP